MIKKEVTVKTDHPMEEFLGIESGSTSLTHTEREYEEGEISDHIHYDDKDKEIENDLAEIKKEALNVFDSLQDQMDTVTDPRQKARLAEVSNQLLNTALATIKDKQKMKSDKDKLSTKQGKSGGPNKIIQNNVFMDRNIMLEKLASGEIIIDGDNN